MAESHDHSHRMTGTKLRNAFLLTALILAVELVGGLLSNSLALLSDAGHVLTDIIALGLAWFATVVDILMEATPKDLNVAQLVRDVVRVPGVLDVHDLHIWSIAGGMSALSAHVQIQDRPLSACDAMLKQLRTLLQERYHIAHTTIQFECTDCGPDDLYCALTPDEEAAEAQHHHEARTDGLDVSAAEATPSET